MNLCGETLREINMFMEYFFSSELENIFYSDEQKAHKRKMKFPCLLLDLEKWPVFRYYNIIFHFHEASVWNCLFFQRLVLKLGNELFYFFRIVMYGHYTHKQKRYKYQRTFIDEFMWFLLKIFCFVWYIIYCHCILVITLVRRSFLGEMIG